MNSSPFPSSKPNGFALTELAIALIIIGVVSGMGISLMTHRLSQKSRQIDEQRHDVIMHALASYALHHNRLPWAADPAASKNQFGSKAENLTVGIVPFRDLGLDPSLVKDSHKNYITYVVYKDLSNITYTGEGEGKRKFCNKDLFKGMNGISFDDFASSKAQFIAIVLISHGSNGHGAFLCNGTRNQRIDPNAGLEEQKNAQALKIGIANTSQNRKITLYKQGAPQSPFRHYISFVTRDNLRAVYGKEPCS